MSATLDRVAVLADEFAVTHKVSFVVYHQRGRGTGLFPKTQTGSASRSPAAASSSDRLCYYCKKSRPVIADCALLHKKKKQKLAKPVAFVAVEKPSPLCELSVKELLRLF